MIIRLIETKIQENFYKGKAVIIIGARQVGKTTLIKQLLADCKDVLWLNGDRIEVRMQFENMTLERLKSLLGNHKIIVIDEAQRIENIGVKLKLITDNFSDIQLIVSGSSAFELSNKINEPLTGRKWEYQLFPISFLELTDYHSTFEEKNSLSVRLIYGSYPEVVCEKGNEKNILRQLSDSYLYKDILEWEQIKKADKLLKLLQALAFQVGNQVSYAELSRTLEINKVTVEKYITFLEKAFVIFKLSSFSRNLRSELNQSKKIYFYDNGIRNALIANFSPIEIRTDTGALWENYLMSERKKMLQYSGRWANSYFWRTKEQQEIDYLEEEDGQIRAYEFKWNTHSKAKITKTFTKAYPDAKTEIITPENYGEFLRG